MIQLIRRFLDSKFGLVAALTFLGLIALAFAGVDISSSGLFGGVAGGDRVATIGGDKISTSDLSRASSATVEQMRRDQPTLTMDVFLRDGGVEQVLDQLIDRHAITEFGEMLGLRTGKRLVDSEIASTPSFRGPDGKFDSTIFKQAIQQSGLNEKYIRQDIAQGLMARQVLAPAIYGVALPDGLVKRYATLLRETRNGQIALLPSAAFIPAQKPTSAQIETYYDAHKSDYIRPERRVIRYAAFDAEALGELRAPSNAEIEARYKRDAAIYAASESRRLTQLIVPTEAAAKAILDETSKGTSLAAAAKSKGLETTEIGPISKDSLLAQSSRQVADAAFTAKKGTVAGPARSSLGWHILRVEAITGTPAKTLDQVREDISREIAAEQRRSAILDLAARLQDEFDEGSSLADAAREVGAEVKETRPLTADGIVYGTPGEKAPDVLAKAISTAFAMEEGEPQLAEIDPGKTFLIFDVKEITPSAAAPLSEIKETVAAAWKRSQGLANAKQAADRVMEKVRKGTGMTEALAEEKKPFPRPDSISMNREQLTQFKGRVPSPLALMFSMAEGTTKQLEAPRELGWFIVKLDKIEPGKIEKDDPIIESTARELALLAGREYGDELRKALRDKVGVQRNEAAIKAVRTQLGGGN